MSADLEQALRQEGTRYHELAERTAGDLTDVNRRTGRQRNRRRAAAGSTVVLGVVVLAVAVGLTRVPQPSSVDQWGTTTEVDPVTSAAQAPATSAPPSTPGSSIATPGSAAPPATAPITSVSIPVTTPTTSASAPDIGTVDFRNFTYPADSCALGGLSGPPAGGMTMRNGRWDAGGGQYVTVDEVSIGDVTGDGRPEAAVKLSCGTSATLDRFSPVWVFAADAASSTGVRRLASPGLTPATLAQVGLADGRVQGAYKATADGQLTVNWFVYPGDAPTTTTPKVVTTYQRWTGSAWQATASPIVHTAGGPT